VNVYNSPSSCSAFGVALGLLIYGRNALLKRRSKSAFDFTTLEKSERTILIKTI